MSEPNYAHNNRPDPLNDAPYTQQPPGYGPGYGHPQPMPPYGQPPMPGYAQGYGLMEHPQAQTIQILGLVGIATGIVSFVAWYMGAQAKKEIDAGAPYYWGGPLKLGYMLGKIFSIITIVAFGLVLLYMIFAIVILAITVNAP